LNDIYHLPFDDNSVDLVLSGQMLEHCPHFWLVFNEIFRILKPNGMAFIIAPSSGPVHRYPVDCYRFYPDSYQALAEWSGLRLVQSWKDERGPWRDLVGVFQKGRHVHPVHHHKSVKTNVNYQFELNDNPEAEIQVGTRDYLEVLKDLHALIKPKLYFEIGVRKGKSLALAKCRTIAIEPDLHPDFLAGENVELHQCTSDDYFFFRGENLSGDSIDLAFIDGMHLAENVFRDFMNIEKRMSVNGVIVLDDVLPNHPIQAERNRCSRVWAGDVWRFAEFLIINRPDLKLFWLNTRPAGLLIITNLNPDERSLWNNYNKLMRKFSETTDTPPPVEILTRQNAIAPTLENLEKIIG
jgi:SAM-dependent methyltransferase